MSIIHVIADRAWRHGWRPGSMQPLTSVAIALEAHRLRAGLTTLGLVIGVAAVIAMSSLGAGAEARIAEQMRGIGSNLIVVLIGRRVLERLTSVASQLTLTEEDARAERDRDPRRRGGGPDHQGRRVVHGRFWSAG